MLIIPLLFSILTILKVNCNLDIFYDYNNNFLFNYKNIYNLALFAKNVYKTELENLLGGYAENVSLDEDSLRVYMYSNIDNSSYVIAIKGTSTILSMTTPQKYQIQEQDIDKSSSVYNDRFNDNLFFSCCFYLESNMYNTTSCLNESYLSFNYQSVKYNPNYKKTKYKCNKKCFKDSLSYENNYINVANKIMKNIIEKIGNIHNKKLVITGHSLGGGIATMLGVMYNKPVVTFQTPGERNYIELIDLVNKSVNYTNIYHVGHNADPIYTGKCNGFTSICNIGGYKIDTKCHIGNTYEYDAIGKLGISESIFTHKISYVIDNIITQFNDTLPDLKTEECNDCKNWSYLRTKFN